ncbi:MAG: sulfate adenylyltransferase [Thermoplasmata archaeon]
MLPPPHGGHLVERLLSDPERDRRDSELADLPQLHPFEDELYDLEKIAVGAYSPLSGFMDADELDSVLTRGRLPNDLPWSMPILLAPRSRADRQTMEGLRPGEEVALLDGADRLVGLLTYRERFPLDRARIAGTVFGTVDPAHPNVADLMAGGAVAIAGPVQLVRPLELPARRLEVSPRQAREEFARRGWASVAAYQCRNPPHTAHEYLQRITLERPDVDGLFVHPVVGRLKSGDYRPEVILAAYEALISAYYPADRVLLASLSIAMRYAGPKAALFLAIVRKNYGCGLYIVGRDQAGTGTYYEPFACHRIFDEFDIGVVPLRYGETFHCRRCDGMASPKTCAHPKEEQVATSQSRIRQSLRDGTPLPTEIIRPEVAKVISGASVLLP